MNEGRGVMTYDQATNIIWIPDLYELGEVAAAAETVLARPGAKFADCWQASYLLTTLRYPFGPQYVLSTSTGDQTMGCDIHLYVERRENDKWISADTWYPDEDDPERKSVYKWGPGISREAGPFYSSRNYNLFAILADVRNGRGFAGCDTGDGFVPIAAPRGVPEDASPEYRQAVTDYGCVGHSHSYITVAELLAYDWTQNTTIRGWVSPREFARFYLDGRPKSWSVGVSGGGIQHISNDEMLALIMGSKPAFTCQDYHAMEREPPIAQTYTKVSWETRYYEECREFLSETMPRLWRLGRPEEVRIVFFFDS